MYVVKYEYNGVRGTVEIDLAKVPQSFEIEYTEDVLSYVGEKITNASCDFTFEAISQPYGSNRDSNRDFTEKAQAFGFTEFKLYKDNEFVPLELAM